MFKNRKKRRLHEILPCGKSQRTWLSHKLSFLCKKHTYTRTAESKTPCHPSKNAAGKSNFPNGALPTTISLPKISAHCKERGYFRAGGNSVVSFKYRFSARPEHDWAAHNKSASVITAHCRLRPTIPSYRIIA